MQDGDLTSAHKEMEKLSKHKDWFVRLYVAEVVGRDPELGTPQIVERLLKDQNPLVAEALKGTDLP